MRIKTVDDIRAGIPEEFRHRFKLTSAAFEEEFWPVLDAFWEATRFFCPVARDTGPVHIVFGASPVSVAVTNGQLAFKLRDDALAVTVGDFVFVDALKLSKFPHQLRVAAFIEEFAHSFLAIADERLVSVVVAAIYPGVRLIDGKYAVVS